MNVLCLHGCNQTMAMFESIMKDFVKIGATSKINFVFTEAKYDHPLGGKTWYHIPLNVPDIGKIEYSADLVDPTLDSIDKLITDHNITCLLGFSQGANVVDTYVAYRNDKRIKSVLMFSGYSLVDTTRQPVLTKALNVCSKSDDVVPFVLQPSCYLNVSLVEHDKGHKMPTSKPMVREIIKFIVDNQ